jgi:hypothetical protein
MEFVSRLRSQSNQTLPLFLHDAVLNLSIFKVSNLTFAVHYKVGWKIPQEQMSRLKVSTK